MSHAFVMPIGLRCEITTKAGEQCRLPAKVRVMSTDCCTAHAKMIKEGKLIVLRRASDAPVEPGRTAHRCAVCGGKIRPQEAGSATYVHVHPSSWLACPHQATPTLEAE
jgi:hypothetical protein